MKILSWVFILIGSGFFLAGWVTFWNGEIIEYTNLIRKLNDIKLVPNNPHKRAILYRILYAISFIFCAAAYVMVFMRIGKY